MSEEDIRTAIQNAAGTKAVLLLPEEPFENLVKQAIRKMSDPCQKCARLVHDELGRIARQLIAAQDLQRYPRLAQSIEDATRDFLCEGLAPAEAMISSLVDCQLAHINTSHPDFVGGSKALRLAQTEVSKRRGGVGQENDEVDVIKSLGGTRHVLGEKGAMLNSMDEKKKGGKKVDPTLYSHDDGVVNLKEPPGKLQATQAETDEEMLQVIVTRILLGSYFSISRGVLADTVPKAVMHFLVNSVGRGLQQHLIQSLYHPNIVPSLLMEHPETEAKRQAAKAKLSALSSAASAMGSMPADLAAAGARSR